MLLHYLAKCRNTKITYFNQLDCVTHTMHLCTIFLKEKLSSVMCLIASNICWGIVRYPINTVHWLLLQAWRRTTPIFYTATDSVTVLAHTEHMGNTQQDAMFPSPARSCLVLPLDRFDSEGWFSSDLVIFLTVFRVFWWKSMQHLSEKMQFPGFLFSQLVQKH